MKTVYLSAILAGFLAMPVSAFEFTAPGIGLDNLGAEVGISTLGAYIAPTYRLDDQFSLRAPVYFGSMDRDDEFEGNDASYGIDLKSTALLADYRPFSGNFRLTAGVAFGGYEASAGVMDPELDGITFPGYHDFKFEQKNKIAPVLAIGYDLAMTEKLSLKAELGGKFTHYEVSTDLNDIPDALRADMRNEIDKINSDLDDFGMTPFLSIGISYKFRAPL